MSQVAEPISLAARRWSKLAVRQAVERRAGALLGSMKPPERQFAEARAASGR
jgi:hypothetical protein